MADRLWGAACSGEVPPELRAEGFAGMFQCVDSVRRTISELYSISTNAAYRSQNRIDRALRDSHAGAAALESFRSIQRDAARVMAGGTAESPAF
jgi:hypothetical protein